ncbi:MAG TPA: serine/threonine-protein kinase, partial [Rugosimonospora sp.]|nr:serine/threonine-protein kinase [Rugosimonospora sp.]
MAVVGEIVAGRFRLVRPVGAGGMGSVWQARDEILARDVAMKQIVAITGVPPAHADVWARTVREARTSARLTHPNVVRVYDVLFADGLPWIVMELVVGRSLDIAVQRDGPFAPPAAARIGLAVLDGLDAAHQAGVLHRDVKPHNVLLADDGRVLLGDFSVAAFDPTHLGWQDTPDEVVIGSPHYLAPERVRSGVSTVETDLWSLGATLYWLVEGRTPFSRFGGAALLTAVATGAPDPQRQSGALAEVINGLLQRCPEDRLTAAAARILLEPVVHAAAEPAPTAEPPPPPEQPVEAKVARKQAAKQRAAEDKQTKAKAATEKAAHEKAAQEKAAQEKAANGKAKDGKAAN